MGQPLKNPPVYFTLAQVRFNTILKIRDFLPSVQEGMRRAGFPVFTQRQMFVLQIGAPGSTDAPQSAPQEQYFFTNTAKTHSFLLDVASLTLQSTRYGTYEDFSRQFLDGLALANDAIALDYTERVGLRYLDHVAPRKGDMLEKYLAPDVQGLAQRLKGEPLHSYIEALNAIGSTQLHTRIFITKGGLAFPPDLQPGGLVIDPRFSGEDGLHATVDTDGFVQERKIFSMDGIRDDFAAIHGAVNEAFYTIVTDHARKAWDAP